MSTDSLQPASDDVAPTDTPSNTDGDTEVSEPETEPETFTATITVGYVQRFLDAICSLDDECRLLVAPGGICARVMGETNATLAEARLDASAFEAYHTDSGGVIGVPVRRLREIVRMSTNSELMQLDLVDSETLRVRAGALDCSLQLRGLATMRSTSGLESDEYPSVVVLEGGELKRILKAAGYVDSAVDFRIQKDDERFVAEADNGDDSFRAPRAADDLVEVFVGEESAASRFDLSYLRKAKRAIRKRTEVTLALGTDLPLSMAFDIADGAGHVEYGIAPMVEADE